MWRTSRKYVLHGIFKNATKHLKCFQEQEHNQKLENFCFSKKYFTSKQTEPKIKILGIEG